MENLPGWTPKDYVTDRKSHVRREALKRIRGLLTYVNYTGREANEDFIDVLHDAWARYAEGCSKRNQRYFTNHGFPADEEADKQFFFWCCQKTAQNLADPIRRRRKAEHFSVLQERSLGPWQFYEEDASDKFESVLSNSQKVGHLSKRRVASRSFMEALCASEERYQRSRRAALAVTDRDAAVILAKLGGGHPFVPTRSELKAAVSAFAAAVGADDPEPSVLMWVSNIELMRVIDAAYLGVELAEPVTVTPEKMPAERVAALATAAVQLPLFVLESA